MNEIVWIRNCVDDLGRTTDDGGLLRICPDCIVFGSQRPARMMISVAAMPCVNLGDKWLTRNSQPSMGKEYARRFAQQPFQQCW